jgi:hypothetical protein
VSDTNLRKVVNVPMHVEFDRAIKEAQQASSVVLTNPRRRFFVVECGKESQLAKLRSIGCEIHDDTSYSID